VDNLVSWINDQEDYGAVAFVHDDRLKAHPNYQHWKSFFKVVKFSEVKNSILLTLSQKMEEARQKEEEHLSLKKEKEEITIPLVFEDQATEDPQMMK
jgi:hypothetical protein